MKRKTEELHWIGETLMAKEFGEVVEICNADWSWLDDFEAEHKCLLAAAHDLEDALEHVVKAFEFDVICVKPSDRKVAEDLFTVINAALAKAKGETQ